MLAFDIFKQIVHELYEVNKDAYFNKIMNEHPEIEPVVPEINRMCWEMAFTQKFNIKVVNVAPGDFKTNIVSRRINTEISNNSFYNKEYSKSLNSANKHVENALSPYIISKLIFNIINSKKPKIHYKVGKFIQKFSIILKNILPDRLFEKILLHYSKN